MGVSENRVPLNPMVLLIIIPIKWLFHWEYTQHFQTNPYSVSNNNTVLTTPALVRKKRNFFQCGTPQRVGLPRSQTHGATGQKHPWPRMALRTVVGFPCTWEGSTSASWLPCTVLFQQWQHLSSKWGLFRSQLSRFELRTCFDTSGSGHIYTSSLTWGPNKKNGGDRDELFEAKSFKVFAHQWTYSMWTRKALITQNTSYGDKSSQVVEYIAPVSHHHIQQGIILGSKHPNFLGTSSFMSAASSTCTISPAASCPTSA